MKKLLWQSGLVLMGIMLFGGSVFWWSKNALENTLADLKRMHFALQRENDLQKKVRAESVFRTSCPKQVIFLQSKNLKRTLDPLFLSDLLKQLTHQYHLQKVKFSIHACDQKESSEFEVLNVTLDLESCQDVLIYRFLTALKNKLYGLTFPLKLILVREQKGKELPKIKGQYTFSWVGPEEKPLVSEEGKAS